MIQHSMITCHQRSERRAAEGEKVPLLLHSVHDSPQGLHCSLPIFHLHFHPPENQFRFASGGGPTLLWLLQR